MISKNNNTDSMQFINAFISSWNIFVPSVAKVVLVSIPFLVE